MGLLTPEISAVDTHHLNALIAALHGSRAWRGLRSDGCAGQFFVGVFADGPVFPILDADMIFAATIKS
jgi:hypothetical protein